MKSKGQRIKELREKQGLTQSQLAKLINKSQGTIAHIEIDEHKGTFEILESLCKVFKVTSDYILFGINGKIEKEDLNEEGEKLLKEYKEYLKEKYPKKEYEKVGNL